MANIIKFPGEFEGIKEKQRSDNESLRLYPTIDTLVFDEPEDDMREAEIETEHVDIQVIHDMEEDDYYVKAGNLLTHCETKEEANAIIRDIFRSLKRL